MSNVKKLLSTIPLIFSGRTVYESKVLIELNDLVVHGTGNFTVKTSAYTIRPLNPGETDYGIMSRLQQHSEKSNTYSDEQINALFEINNIPILTTDNFSHKIRIIMSNVFLLSVCLENTFGLNSAENWEFLTE